MFASMIPIYGRAVRGNLARLFAYVALLFFGAVTLAWWGFLAWLFWRAHKRAREPGPLRGVQLTASRESCPKNSD
jgi:hypothetical protein